MLYWENIQADEEDPRISIWHIEETEEEMLSLFPEEAREEMRTTLSRYKHTKRRMELLTARLLISMMTQGKQGVRYEPSGRPYLTSAQGEINISHTHEFVAVAIHKHRRVALDIEKRGEKVKRVMHKYVNERERAYLSDEEKEKMLQLHILWSAKETMYKIMSSSEVDFAEHLYVGRFDVGEVINGKRMEGAMPSEETKTEDKRKYNLRYKVFPDFVLVWTME